MSEASRLFYMLSVAVISLVNAFPLHPMRLDWNARSHPGHPLEASRVFDMTRYSSLPILGVNYRKAVTSSRSFPAALQDTISAYAYLLREGYTCIALAGDSAGAGLGVAIMQYLARLSEKPEEHRPGNLILPTAACFYSPWVDLTFSHDYRETVHFDISESLEIDKLSGGLSTNFFR